MSETIIKNADGSIKFRIRRVDSTTKQIVDANGTLLGTIRHGKTFDNRGTLVSHGEDVSALIH